MAQEMNPVMMQEIMGVMNANNIIQNILGIALIEIEQLNPRIRSIQGAMKIRYVATGGNIKDPDGAVSYEYDWVGGTIEFVPNPYPRVPLGTGNVAFVADDESDPTGRGVALPDGAKSGNATGWNREFLASHYGEAYWRIVKPEVDAEIRARYRSILLNSGIPVADAEKMVADAANRQNMGMAGNQKVTVSRSSGPLVRNAIVKQQPTAGEIEKHPMMEAVRKENEELRDMIRKLSEQNRPTGKNRACAAKGKEGNPCKGKAQEGSEFCIFHKKKGSAVVTPGAEEPMGNIGE